MRCPLLFSVLVMFFGLTIARLPAQTALRHCASSERHHALLQLMPELIGWEKQFEESYRRKEPNPAKSNNNYTLPVVVHVIHHGGVENISDAQIEQGIAYINQAFANEGWYSAVQGVNTPFQFCLASRRPDGGPTNGINRIDSETTDGSQFDQAVHQLISWDTKEYINIWLVKEICTNAAGCEVTGFAHFPIAHGQVFDGIVVEAAFFGSSPVLTNVVVHEMGHYLGLLHVFEAGCANDDCLANGDKVCDTPPDNSIVPNLPCGYGENSCSTDANPNDPNNPILADLPDFTDDFMDYGNLNCLKRFTQGQADRMEFALLNTRQSLLSSKGCGIPCPNPPSVIFTSSASFIEPSQTVSFNSISTNVLDFEWTVNGVPFSTEQNASYTFTTEGDYIIKLTGSNGDPICDSVSFSKTIKVYCIAIADFDGPPGSLLAGSSFTFENSSQNATAYTWMVNGTVVGTSMNLTYPFYTAGIYEVYLQANNNNCSNDRKRYVEVRDPCDDVTNVFQGNMNYRINALGRLSNGDYIVAGGNDAGFVARMNTAMEGAWAKSVSNAGGYSLVYNSLSVGQNGELFLGGETLSPDFQIKRGVLTKMEAGGQMLWHRIFDSPSFDRISGITPQASGGILAALSNQQPNAPYAVVAMDANGNQLWQKSWKPASTNLEIDINKLIRADDGGFLMGSGIFNFNGGISSQAGLIKLNPMGDQVWFKRYKNDDYRLLYALHLTELPDGGVLFVSRLYRANPLDNGLALIRTKANGDLLWAKKLQIKGYEPNIHWTKNIALKPNGHFAIAFHLYPDISAVIEFTEDGEVAWQKYYQPNLYLEFNPGDIISDEDGYLISTLTPNLYSGSIWRTNAYGNAGYCDQALLNYSLENLPLDTIPISTIPVNELVLPQAFFPMEDNRAFDTLANNCQPANQPMHIDIGLQFLNKKYCQGTLEVELKVCNNGEVAIPAGLPINLYTQNPTLFATNSIENLATNAPLQPSEFASFTLTINNPVGHQIYAAGNIAGNATTPFALDANFEAWMAECNAFDNLDSINFWPYLPPSLSLGPDTAICPNQPFLFHAPQRFEHILWSNGTSDTTLLVNTAGLYWLTATDSCGGLQKDSIEISFTPPSPTLDLGPDQVGCPSEPRTFVAGGAFASYQWQDGSTAPSFTAYQPGKYWVEALDACGQLQADTVLFTADSASAIELGDDIVSCTNHSFVLDAGLEFEHIQWLPNLEIDCNDCQRVTVSPTQSRTYLVIGETANGCIETDTLHFDIGQTDVSAILDTTICATDTLWINGHSMQPGSSMTFHFTASNGCDSTLLVIVNGVTVSLPPNIEIAFGDSVTLLPDLGTEATLSFHWSPSTGLSCTDCPTPTVFVLDHQLFTLTVSDAHNCVDSANVLVAIQKGPRPAYIPNVFSPNNDGINDSFTIYGDKRIKNIQLLRIFDRWGGLIFEDQNFAPGKAGWDGSSHGQIMGNGVYAFLAEVVWLDGKVEVLSGEVILLR